MTLTRAGEGGQQEIPAMSLFQKIFGPKDDPAKEAIRPLYARIVEKARELHWYEEGGVADSLDGRFEMIAAMMSLVLIRLDQAGGQDEKTVLLTEIFIDDMDGQLREIGVGDMIVGKHLGKMMAALGGRMGAYRDGMSDKAKLTEAVMRNIFRGETPENGGTDHVVTKLEAEMERLTKLPPANIAGGAADW